MSNSRFPVPQLLWIAIVAVLATSGCASISGTTEKWAASWKKNTQPKPVDPNHEEIVTYWGLKNLKRKEPKPSPISAEMKERLAKNSDPQQRLRDYADQFKTGNQRLKEGRLDEARRAYEQALVAKPNDPDVHHRLAVVADKQQMFGVADDHYEAALRQRPRDPNLLSDIGYSNLLRGDDRRAEVTLRQALSIDPAHEGAMLNLGTLYGKQGRYEEALALFRRGTTDGKSRQYMAQLFPQGPPSGVSLASNQEDARQRFAPLMPADEQLRLDRLTDEQLRSEIQRRRIDGGQTPSSQFAQINPQRDWTGETARSDSGASPQNYDFPMGNAPSNSAGGPAAAQSSNLPPGQPPSAPNGASWNNGVQQQNYTVPAPQSRGSLVAPPGTSPHSNMEFWQGANVPPNSGSSPNQAGFAATPSSSSAPFAVEQMSYTQPDSDGAASASRAAAQLGMSAGPGSLFPVVIGNAAAAGGTNRQFAPSNGSNYEQRFGGEYAQPPQYQQPGQSPAPANAAHRNQIQLLGGDSANFNPTAPNGPGAAPRSNGTAPQRSDSTDAMNSVWPSAGNIPHPWEAGSFNPSSDSNAGSNVSQAGGNSPWNLSETRAGDPLDSFASGSNAGRKSRYAKTPWNDPNSEPIGARPYNGAWPNTNASPSNNGGSPNSLPLWNGGSNAGSAVPNSASPATGSSNAGTPPQWPYSAPR